MEKQKTLIEKFNTILTGMLVSNTRNDLVDIYCSVKNCNSLTNYSNSESIESLRYRLRAINDTLEYQILYK